MPTLLLAILLAAHDPAPPLRVVTSLTTYAAIAREIVGDRATVTAIADGSEDPHFVQPRPSFVPLLRSADLFVTTGMDLELWVPALLDRAGNTGIREGGAGYVSASHGIRLLEVPASVSRALGDIHVDGNPHITGDPVNAVVIARNILAGLARISPADAAYFTERERDFEVRILRATFGDELVRIVTPAALYDLASADRLMDFLQRTPYQGRPLLARLGGWTGQAQGFRGRTMVCYHRQYAYFSRRFGVSCVEYVEVKPGIPPTPRHVQEVIALMRDRRIPAIVAATYYDSRQVRDVAARTGAAAVILPEHTEGAHGVTTYFELVDTWITELQRVFAATPGASR